MLADMQNRGTLVACDVRPRRTALLQETVRASGAVHIHVVRVGESGALPFRCRFDRVLADVPCSGLGTIRRDPDIRWRRTAEDLPVFARAQVALLERAATMLRSGGRLVYSTCSSEPEENEAVVDTFLASHRAFTLVDLRSDGHPAVVPFVDDRGMMRTLPFVHGLDGFYAAALTRRA